MTSNINQEPLAKLVDDIALTMKGFRATNVIAYRRSSDKVTWMRPGEMASQSSGNDEDEFTPDPKEYWPTIQDMNRDVPIKEITKLHRVPDPAWSVPPSTKKPKQPEPVYPQSRGFKLRNLEVIMKDLKSQPNQHSNQKPGSSSSTTTATPTQQTRPPTTRQESPRRFDDHLPDTIKGVLQNINDPRKLTRSNPTKTTNIYMNKRPESSKQSTLARKPPLPKSRTVNEQKPYPTGSSSNTIRATQGTPNVSSKRHSERFETTPSSVEMSPPPTISSSSKSHKLSVSGEKKPQPSSSANYGRPLHTTDITKKRSDNFEANSLLIEKNSSSSSLDRSPTVEKSPSSSTSSSRPTLKSNSTTRHPNRPSQTAERRSSKSDLESSHRDKVSSHPYSKAVQEKKSLSTADIDHLHSAAEKSIPKANTSSKLKQRPTATSRPRVSAKSTPVEKIKPIENVPDLTEACKYLLGQPDEVELRSLSILRIPTPRASNEVPRLSFSLASTPKKLAACSSGKLLKVEGRMHKLIKTPKVINRQSKAVKKPAPPSNPKKLSKAASSSVATSSKSLKRKTEELEEGETISPSPSPKKDSYAVDILKRMQGHPKVKAKSKPEVPKKEEKVELKELSSKAAGKRPETPRIEEKKEDLTRRSNKTESRKIIDLKANRPHRDSPEVAHVSEVKIKRNRNESPDPVDVPVTKAKRDRHEAVAESHGREKRLRTVDAETEPTSKPKATAATATAESRSSATRRLVQARRESHDRKESDADRRRSSHAEEHDNRSLSSQRTEPSPMNVSAHRRESVQREPASYESDHIEEPSRRRNLRTEPSQLEELAARRRGSTQRENISRLVKSPSLARPSKDKRKQSFDQGSSDDESSHNHVADRRHENNDRQSNKKHKENKESPDITMSSPDQTIRPKLVKRLQSTKKVLSSTGRSSGASPDLFHSKSAKDITASHSDPLKPSRVATSSSSGEHSGLLKTDSPSTAGELSRSTKPQLSPANHDSTKSFKEVSPYLASQRKKSPHTTLSGLLSLNKSTSKDIPPASKPTASNQDLSTSSSAAAVPLKQSAKPASSSSSSSITATHQVTAAKVSSTGPSFTEGGSSKAKGKKPLVEGADTGSSKSVSRKRIPDSLVRSATPDIPHAHDVLVAVNSNVESGSSRPVAGSSSSVRTPQVTATSPRPPISSPRHSTSSPSQRTLSATAPNANTPEQYKIFNIMFKQLALANKRRGDKEPSSAFGTIDHFHALCDYILSFYFIDKANTNMPFKQLSISWKSLFPFCEILLQRLKANQMDSLHSLCLRLIALIRFYIYNRMEVANQPVLKKHLESNTPSTDPQVNEMIHALFREHDKAKKFLMASEKHMSFGAIAQNFPETFKAVCQEGDVRSGITLGGEAGVKVGPMFPFVAYSELHHAAIVSKCMLSEYVTKEALDYSPITRTEEYM